MSNNKKGLFGVGELFLILGLSMFVINMIYPLEKQHELELKVNKFYLDSALLVNNINKTTDKLDDLKEHHISVTSELDSLSKLLGVISEPEKATIEWQIMELKENYTEHYSNTNRLLDSNKLNFIKLEAKGHETIVMLDQIEEYKSYISFFNFFGSLFLLICLLLVFTAD